MYSLYELVYSLFSVNVKVIWKIYRSFQKLLSSGKAGKR